MSRVIIFSLNFNAAHISHLLASYLQCAELGYEPILCLHERFEPFFVNQDIKYIIYKRNPLPKDVVLSFFLFTYNKLPNNFFHKLC